MGAGMSPPNPHPTIHTFIRLVDNNCVSVGKIGISSVKKNSSGKKSKRFYRLKVVSVREITVSSLTAAPRNTINRDKLGFSIFRDENNDVSSQYSISISNCVNITTVFGPNNRPECNFTSIFAHKIHILISD